VELLRRDNVASPDFPGLEALGISPTAPEGIVDSYLYRYRKAGQFSTITPDKSVSADRSPTRA